MTMALPQRRLWEGHLSPGPGSCPDLERESLPDPWPLGVRVTRRGSWSPAFSVRARLAAVCLANVTDCDMILPSETARVGAPSAATSEVVMRKFKLVLAGLAVTALTLIGASAPADAAGSGAVTGQNLWCC